MGFTMIVLTRFGSLAVIAGMAGMAALAVTEEQSILSLHFRR